MILRIRVTPPSWLSLSARPVIGRNLRAWIEQAVRKSTILFGRQVAGAAGPLEPIDGGDIVQDRVDLARVMPLRHCPLKRFPEVHLGLIYGQGARRWSR